MSISYAFGHAVSVGKAASQANIATDKAKEAISRIYEVSGRIDLCYRRQLALGV